MLYQIVSGSGEDGNQWEDGSGEEGRTPDLFLAIIAIRSTGVNFIANFPEIHPIFSANSSVKVKDFDVQKIDSGVLQTELCARAIRKRDGAGIAPYQQAC